MSDRYDAPQTDEILDDDAYVVPRLSVAAQRRIGLGVFLALLVLAGVFLITLQPKSGRPPVPTAGTTVRIPIEVVRYQDDIQVLVPVTIDGRGPYRFALDTGASTTAVNGIVLRAVRAEDTGEDADFTDASGDTTASRLFRLRRWSVGSVPLQGGATVSNLARPLDVDGLLGSDQLARFGSVTIDYAAERLILRPRSGN